METYKKISIWAIVMSAVFLFGPALSFAGGDYDDVYENEIDKNTDLKVEDITEEDLRAFFEAAKEIKEIRAEYARKIHNEGDKRFKELRSEAVHSMVEAIKTAGLDEETYRGIAYHVNQDKKLVSRIF
jgi:sRNA-binding carbon storage regulator CsrA